VLRDGAFPKLIGFVESSAFTRFIIVTILFAGVVVGLETSKEVMASHGTLLHALDKTILWIFAVEAALKIASHWPRPFDYFKDSWNVFDFTIVAVCFLPFGAEYVAVLRLARVLRVLRLLTVVPKLQLLVTALLKSIPSMFYISILLSILFYIYAVLGVMMFGANDPIHFGNLGDSLLSLFRVVTLEDWTDIMYINMYGSDQYGYLPEQIAEHPDIVHQAHGFGAVVFHVSFVLFGTMIMLNLFIGVIMTGMQEAAEETEALKTGGENKARKPGDYSAIVEELHELEEHVEALREKMRSVRRRSVEGGGE
jgi:voltage-gated sodium channel